VASAWLERAETSSGPRWRVKYQLGGREARRHYGGSFKTKREALARQGWIATELAAMRVPDLTLLREPERAPTVREAAERWKASRVDVGENTRVVHRVALDRVLPILGTRRVDELTVDHVNDAVATLAASGRKRSTIRKSVKYLAAVLDDAGIEPNPARDTRVRLPHEQAADKSVPLADHVETVFMTLASAYRPPFLWLDWSGARLASIETLRVGDYDEPGRRVWLRASTQKTGKPRWVELHPVLAEGIKATLPPREDRDPDLPLFPGAGADRLRTAIIRACKAAGIPTFTPHRLRDRRVSLLHEAGWSAARIAEFVGHDDLTTTLDVYTHVMGDGREADYAELLVGETKLGVRSPGYRKTHRIVRCDEPPRSHRGAGLSEANERLVGAKGVGVHR
jgi:integrase